MRKDILAINVAIIARDLLPTLHSHTSPKICVLFGPRRSGKTTLLRELCRGKNVTWFNGDNAADVSSLDLPSGASIRSLLMSCETLIIDEAQRVPGIGLLLKRLADENILLEKPVRIFATGSSSFDLSAGVKESALGRLREHFVWPLSMSEIAQSTNWTQALLDVNTRIVFGMFPENYVNPQEARENLQEHCTSLLFKDIFNLSGIRYSAKFEHLVQLLAYSIGNIVSYDGLSRETGLSKVTVMDYLRLLEQCFIIKVCPSYSKNLSSELKKSKKIYFCDNGIRNALIGDFSPLEARADAGSLWENFFYMERVKRNSLRRNFAKLYFWRTSGRNPREVDFLEITDTKMQAFECKLSAKAQSRAGKTFSAAYPDCPIDIVTAADLQRLWT